MITQQQISSVLGSVLLCCSGCATVRIAGEHTTDGETASYVVTHRSMGTDIVVDSLGLPEATVSGLASQTSADSVAGAIGSLVTGLVDGIRLILGAIVLGRGNVD